MRVVALVVVATLGVLLGSGVADAEKVRTNQSTKLLARPGEQAKVLLTVKSGQNMKLLNQEGRWLKVRVQGRTGYVPRSKVDMADDGGISRNTRRRPFVDGRGKRRGFGGDSAPDDRVGADAVGDSGGGDDEADDEEEEEDEPKKKPAAKTPPPKVAATKGKPADDEEDEEEDEEDDAPAPKKAPPAKTPAKAPPPKVAVATKATPSKTTDDDEEADEEEDADADADEDEDEDADKPVTKSGSDDEDPIGGDEKGEEDEEEARPVARVNKKVSVYEEADAESSEEFVVRPTDLLYPMESKGGWTFVENAEGDSGWIMSDALVLEGSGGGAGSTGRRVIDIRARAGLTIIQQGMRTAGSNVLEVPDNYNIGTSSLTLSVGAGILIPKGKLLLGGEFTYDYAKALGGGVPYDADPADATPPVNIGITLHNVNVRALAGLDLKKKSGMTLFGRLGYRYQGFLITDVANFTANPALLPSEVVKAPTLGAALSIPRLTEKIGIKFSLDAILFAASVKQTVGLEDGTAPSVKAVTLGTDLTYKVAKSIDLMATYNLSYMNIDFGAPMMSSMRNHMGTSVARTDIFHIITFGIAKPF
jgi:hypothetical protein